MTKSNVDAKSLLGTDVGKLVSKAKQLGIPKAQLLALFTAALKATE